MKKRILIVEDEESILLLLRSLFKNDHNEVVTAANSKDAMEALSLHGFDLVITDVRLHWTDEQGGIRLLEHVKKNYPSVEVIVMTGYGSNGMRDDAIRKGALHFYEKPFDIKHLSKLVHMHLGISVRMPSHRFGQPANPV